jgi:hypothetical protein
MYRDCDRDVRVRGTSLLPQRHSVNLNLNPEVRLGVSARDHHRDKYPPGRAGAAAWLRYAGVTRAGPWPGVTVTVTA